MLRRRRGRGRGRGRGGVRFFETDLFRRHDDFHTDTVTDTDTDTGKGASPSRNRSRRGRRGRQRTVLRGGGGGRHRHDGGLAVVACLRLRQADERDCVGWSIHVRLPLAAAASLLPGCRLFFGRESYE